MSKELLQQALDALEEATAYTSSPSWSPSMTEECTAVAAAIRAVLAAQPAPVPVPLTERQLDAALEAWFTNLGSFQARMRVAIEAAHGIAASPEVP
jgi:hypothetical protein